LERVKDTYLQQNLFTRKNKEETVFSRTKGKYEAERYLSLKNFEHRSAITKLRTGAHDLLIEKGKWLHLELHERVFKFCECSKIEDESHFLFECTAYKEIRNYAKTKTEFPLDNLENLNTFLKKPAFMR